MKRCSKCKIEKDLNDFYKCKNGYRYECKECCKKMVKEYNESNKEKIKIKQKIYRENNKERRAEINKKWLENNKEKRREYKRKLYLSNKKNPFFILKESIRNSIRKSIKNKNYTKNSKTEEILGCSYKDFKKYIESKFEPWMTWENYGLYNGELNYGWDIDHIIPISSAQNEEDVIKLNHYTNLQPLCSKVNRDIKKDKVI